MTKHSSKPRHIRFDDDDEEVPGHAGLAVSDIPEEKEDDDVPELIDDEYDEEYEVEEDDTEDLILERLDVISQTLVNSEGTAIADVLSSIDRSLKIIAKVGLKLKG